jgi:ribosomal protein S18 acetylase RimI-like enzyme
MIQVELVTAANARILDRVDEDVFDFPVQRAYVEAFLASPTNLLVVAVESGTVVGMATGLLYTHPDKPLQMFVNEVGVSRRFHRQGIGSKLVRALLHRARELGCQEAWVATEAGNTAARALFTATGGREHDEQAVVYFYRFDTPAQDDAR